MESSLPEQRGIAHSVTNCCHTSAGSRSLMTCIFCIVSGESPSFCCGGFAWEIAHDNNKNANMADVDILIIVMHFNEFFFIVMLCNVIP